MDFGASAPTVVDLPPEASSTPRARHFVRAALTGTVPIGVVETAELCVSELVTNAVLHARTEIRVSIGTEGDGVRLTVEDRSPARPLQSPRTRTAATGRGLMLVTTLAREWGVDPVIDGRKAVWCVLGLAPTDHATAHEDAGFADTWDFDLDRAFEPTVMTERAGVPGANHVVLLGFPIRLGIRHDEHYAALVRECQLLREAALRRAAETGESPRHEVPHRLAELAATLGAQPKPDTSEPVRLRTEAFARGDDTIDLVYPVRPGAAAQVKIIEDLLDEMDAYSANNELLTLATPPEIRQLLSWVLAEYAGQEQGLTPRPWNGPLQ